MPLMGPLLITTVCLLAGVENTSPGIRAAGVKTNVNRLPDAQFIKAETAHGISYDLGLTVDHPKRIYDAGRTEPGVTSRGRDAFTDQAESFERHSQSPASVRGPSGDRIRRSGFLMNRSGDEVKSQSGRESQNSSGINLSRRLNQTDLDIDLTTTGEVSVNASSSGNFRPDSKPSDDATESVDRTYENSSRWSDQNSSLPLSKNDQANSRYLERAAEKAYNGSSLKPYEVKLEFLRVDYIRVLRTLFQVDDVRSRQVFPFQDGISPGCYDDLMDWFDVVGSSRADVNSGVDVEWAAKMFDAFGRPSAGLKKGALQMEGNYDECLETRAFIPAGVRFIGGVRNSPRTFDTRYCRVEIPVGSQFKLGLPHVVNKFWTEKESFHLRFNWGVCVPASCHSEDVKIFLNTGALRGLNLDVVNAVCFDEPSLSEDAGAMTTVIILVMFVALLTACTILDIYRLHRPWCVREVKEGHSEDLNGGEPIALNYFCNGGFEVEVPPPDDTEHPPGNGPDLTTTTVIVEESSNGVNQRGLEVNNKVEKQTAGEELIRRVSFYSNFLKLLNTKGSNDTFTCLHGLKVISMAWIVAGHCYTYGGLLDETNIVFKNTVELVATAARLSFHLVGSAHLAVDTFFVISGFLVMVITLKTMSNRSKPLFWLTFFFHRFWRLTPMYMMVLAVGTNLYDHVVKGPLKAVDFEEFEQCKEKWWAHLLYINNFYRPDQKCMTWTWYMSVDMQLYVLSPVFIYATHRSRKIGVALLISLCCTGIVCAFIAEYLNGGQFVLMDLRFLEYWSYVYTMPYARVAAYSVGMLLGAVTYDHKGKPLVPKYMANLLWLVVIAMGVFLVLINHSQWKMDSEHWSTLQQSFYESLVRPTWALCVAWVIFACNSGQGGKVNAILSWKPFVVLSRLTYAVYLLHPVVIMFVVYSSRTTIYLHPAYLSLAYNYIGNLVITYLLAIVFSLTFEVPMMALERLILGRH